VTCPRCGKINDRDLNAALNASKCHDSRGLSWWTGGRRLVQDIAEKIPVCMQMLMSY
jgi:hypothetical protein